MFGTIKSAQETVGKVTKGNNKVHGSTYSIHPELCKNGAKLAKIKGSVCNQCYAVRLGKIYPTASKAWLDNLALFEAHERAGTLHVWAEGMAFQIRKISNNKAKKGVSGVGFHRWFAAGDLQSMDMLRAIVHTAKLTPEIRHWLPTKEARLIREYLAKNLEGFPPNLTVRVSAPMIDQRPIKGAPNTSTVHSKGQKGFGFVCPAYSQGGDCGNCVTCWDPSIKNISYQKH